MDLIGWHPWYLAPNQPRWNEGHNGHLTPLEERGVRKEGGLTDGLEQ